MGLCCKLAGLKYDIEHKYPVIMKLEHRMNVVETVLNKNNPCFENRCKGRCVHPDCALKSGRKY